MHDLIDSGDLPEQRTIYPTLDEDQQIGTVQFVLIHKDLIPESRIDRSGATALRIKYAIRHVCGNPIKWFGLTAYNPVTETQPLFVAVQPVAPLKPVALRKVKRPVTLQVVLAKQEEQRLARERQISEGEALDAARQVAREFAEANKVAQTDKADKAEKAEKTGKAAKAVKAGKVTKTAKTTKTRKTTRKAQKSEKSDKSDKSDKSEKSGEGAKE
jgi:KUP system potassium uptake protein